MIHARHDYNAIQDSPLSTVIGKDEPVFLLRAKDKFAPDIVRAWAEKAKEYGDIALYEHVMIWADEMETWQREHGSKIPDTPKEQLIEI